MGTLFFFGLGVLALLILLLAGFFAQSKIVVILAGVIATVLMVLKIPWGQGSIFAYWDLDLLRRVVVSLGTAIGMMVATLFGKPL